MEGRKLVNIQDWMMKTLLWIQDRLIIGSIIPMVLLGILWISGGLLTAANWPDLAQDLKPLFSRIYDVLITMWGLVIAISLARCVVDLVNGKEPDTGRY